MDSFFCTDIEDVFDGHGRTTRLKCKRCSTINSIRNEIMNAKPAASISMLLNVVIIAFNNKLEKMELINSKQLIPWVNAYAQIDSEEEVEKKTSLVDHGVRRLHSTSVMMELYKCFPFVCLLWYVREEKSVRNCDHFVSNSLINRH